MGFRGTIGELRFLYIGVTDTSAAVARYESAFGARLRWRFERFGADVAALDLGPDAPVVMLADHRPAGSVLPILVLDDLAAAVAAWQADGLGVAGPMETPEGPVAVVHDEDGAELAFLQLDRADVMDGAWADGGNTHRVDPPAS